MTTVSILLVDDSEDLLQATHDLLVQPGDVVLTAKTSSCAEKLLGHQEVA